MLDEFVFFSKLLVLLILLDLLVAFLRKFQLVVAFDHRRTIYCIL